MFQTSILLGDLDTNVAFVVHHDIDLDIGYDLSNLSAVLLVAPNHFFKYVNFLDMLETKDS
jgi:hypothetical protein